MNERAYWKKHWEFNDKFKSDNPQVKVGRTVFGEPISNKSWEKTLGFLRTKLQLRKEKNILDLCCGNGLVSIDFAKHVKKVFSVDFSKNLIRDLQAHKIANIDASCEDVNELNYKSNTFDVIIIYFAIQHFNHTETTLLIKKAHGWLKKGGMLYIGDIPDEKKIWQFFNQKKYRKKYFESIENSSPIIGNWFTKEFYNYLGEYLNFKNVEIINQKKYMINNHYRFDVLMTK